MTLKQLARQLKTDPQKLEKYASRVLIKNALRSVEAELFVLMKKYGVSSVDQLDKKIQKGDVSEETVGEDFFRLDYLIEQRQILESLYKKDQASPSISTWNAIANMPESQKWSFLQ